MASTIGEELTQRGFERGFAKGREQMLREVLTQLLEEHFGPLNAQVRGRLEALPVERLSPLVNKLSKAQSLKELGLAE